MNDIIKIVQALEDSSILLKVGTKTIENETKVQKGGLLSMLLATLVASLLGNLLFRKGIVRVGYGRPLSPASQNNKGKGIMITGYGNQLKNKMDF